MSATIYKNKMKFSLFGRGYDDARVNSGDGDPIEEVEPNKEASTAVIDVTGQYLWTVNAWNGGNVYKWDISDPDNLVDEEQSILYRGGNLVHPANVENNYGIHLCQHNGDSTLDITVFDMTDDTVYLTLNTSSYTTFYDVSARIDAILVDDKIYLANIKYSFILLCIDLTNQTVTGTAYGYECFYGFINDNLMYTSNLVQWFSDHLTQYGRKLDGSAVWSVTSSGPGYANVKTMGLIGNNYMWLPTLRSSWWRMGKYKGISAPEFEPIPRCSADFGKLAEADDTSTVGVVAYEDRKENVAFCYGYALYVSDYTDMTLLEKAEDNVGAYDPLCLRGSTLVSSNRFTHKIKIYTL